MSPRPRRQLSGQVPLSIIRVSDYRFPGKLHQYLLRIRTGSSVPVVSERSFRPTRRLDSLICTFCLPHFTGLLSSLVRIYVPPLRTRLELSFFPLIYVFTFCYNQTDGVNPPNSLKGKNGIYKRLKKKMGFPIFIISSLKSFLCPTLLTESNKK